MGMDIEEEMKLEMEKDIKKACERYYFCSFCVSCWGLSIWEEEKNKAKKKRLLEGCRVEKKRLLKKRKAKKRKARVEKSRFKSRYSNKFREKSKELKVEARNNRGCCLCGSHEYLTVHHANLDVDNNSDENLVVLCWDCHSKFHRHMHKKPDWLPK